MRFFPAVSDLTPAPVLLALCAITLASRLRAPWLTRGDFGRAVAAWGVSTVVLSGIGLIGWWSLTRPDISDLTLASLSFATPSRIRRSSWRRSSPGRL
jgi:hypothetical protein